MILRFRSNENVEKFILESSSGESTTIDGSVGSEGSIAYSLSRYKVISELEGGSKTLMLSTGTHYSSDGFLLSYNNTVAKAYDGVKESITLSDVQSLAPPAPTVTGDNKDIPYIKDGDVRITDGNSETLVNSTDAANPLTSKTLISVE